jgi:hypothetical protein
VSISSDDDTDFTELDGEYDSECDSNIALRMADDVDAPDGVDLDGDLDMESDGEDEEDEEEEDEKQEEVVVDEDEEEDEDENNGKEPRTIGQGEMLNTSADDGYTMVDDQSTALPEQSQELRKHTPQPQPLVPAPQPETPLSGLQLPTPETHTLSGLEFLGFVTGQKDLPAVSTLQEAEAAGNISDVDLEQQLLGASAGGDSPPEVILPDVHLPNVPLRDVALPVVPLPRARTYGSVGKE